MKPKQTLLIDCKNGVTTNEHRQVEHVTTFFKQFFNHVGASEILNVPPTPMENPFSAKEIESAIKKLKTTKPQA